MSRVRLLIVVPSGHEHMFRDGRRIGIAGTDTTGGVTWTVGLSAIGESPPPAPQYSAYPSRSQEFGRYEGSPRAEDSRDRERVRDSRENYQIRAVSGRWETAMAELTKQVGGLIQEVRGIKTRLDSYR